MNTTISEKAAKARSRRSKIRQGRAPTPKGKKVAGTRLVSPEFGSWLRRTREGMELQVLEMAEKCHMSVGAYRDFELGRGSTNQSVVMFESLAEGIGLDLGYLLYKAGLTLGSDGVNLARVERMEEVGLRLDAAEPIIRSALAETIEALSLEDNEDDRFELRTARQLQIIRLSRALSELDLVTTRLKERRNA